MIGIYRITNLITKKHYIGQSINIERRFREHCRRNEQQIDMSIQKYGIDNFEFVIVEECLPEELNSREDYWIQYYNSIVPYGYNIGFCHNTNYGEYCASSKLTNEDIILMRNIYAKKQYHSAHEVWEQYFKNKISPSWFLFIFKGDAWSHIMPEVFSEENNNYYYNLKSNWMYHQDGENNHQTIVSEEDVIKIRALYQTKERKEIFKLFPQYKERTITSIISGQNWKSLPIYKKRNKEWYYPENYTDLQKEEWIERIKKCLK